MDTVATLRKVEEIVLLHLLYVRWTKTKGPDPQNKYSRKCSGQMRAWYPGSLEPNDATGLMSLMWLGSVSVFQAAGQQLAWGRPFCRTQGCRMTITSLHNASTYKGPFARAPNVFTIHTLFIGAVFLFSHLIEPVGAGEARLCDKRKIRDKNVSCEQCIITKYVKEVGAGRSSTKPGKSILE